MPLLFVENEEKMFTKYIVDILWNLIKSIFDKSILSEIKKKILMHLLKLVLFLFNIL